MGDSIPQKIGERYHFLSPSNQVDFDRIRTMMGRYWEIGSAFGFVLNKPTIPMLGQANSPSQMLKFAPVFEGLARKRIAQSVISDFVDIAMTKYEAWTAPVNLIAAAKIEPLGPAFPAREQEYRTRFLNVPKFPKEYFIFQPEFERNGIPLIYTSDTAKVLERRISATANTLERLQPPETTDPIVQSETREVSKPSNPVRYTNRSGGSRSPEQVTEITRAGTATKRGATGSPIQRAVIQSSQVLRGFSKMVPSTENVSPLWRGSVKTLSPGGLSAATNFKNDPKLRATTSAIEVVESEEVKRLKNRLAADQSALKWSQQAALSNDGSQYEVHNLFLNSWHIGSKEVTELNESKMAGDGEFESPWKPTKAFQVPLYKVVANLTNDLLGASVNSTVTYEDYVFNFARPLSRNIVEKMNAGNSRIRYGVANEECQYSYYLENYERSLQTPAVSERIVPNVYAVNMVQYFTDKGPMNASEWQRIYNPELEYIVTSKGAISQEKVQFRVARNDTEAITQHRKVGRVRKKRGNTNANSAYMEYLEEWRKSQSSSDEAFMEIANDRSRNVIFAAKNYNFIQEVSSKSENIPMCSKIEFAVESSIPKNDSIAEVFRKSNCLSLLMIKAMEHSRPTSGANSLSSDALASWNRQDFNYFPESIQTNSDGSPTEWETTELESVTVPSFDIRSFLDGVVNFGVDSTLDTMSEFQYTLIHDGYEMDPFTYKDYRKTTHAKLQMSSLLINGMMHRLVEKRMRSFSDIMTGKKATTEVVFYEIEKTKVHTNGSREVVQRFWVPNFSGRETIELVDSQVKYDASYQYSVHAWTAIFGNMYRYDTAVGFNQKTVAPSKIAKMLKGKQRFERRQEDGWKLGIVNRPTLKLARLPYYEFDTIRIVDNPPIPPQVDIVPFRGINNKIKINLNASVDDYTVPPIALGASDFSYFIKNYQGQYNSLDANLLSDKFVTTGKAEIPLRFKSDDLPKWFEIYRIGFAPRRWKDFEGSLHTMLDVEKGITSFVDQISPNTQYYYVFRSVDIHGNISNPSNILSVKLMDDQGVFPIIEPYDFEMTENTSRKFNKQVRRFLQITPVFEQVVYKEERQEEEATTIANTRNIRLGVAKDSIYGKRLKFRITSKKSGRKIDLNVSFTHKHLKPPK